MFHTIIFDMDGTILNTLEDLADSVNYALLQCGFPKRTLDEVRCFVGNGVQVLIDRAVPAGTNEKEKETCLSIYREYYNQNMQNKTRPYNGILELLKQLKSYNYKLAIVSNKYDSAVKSLCKEYYSDFIQVAIGESDLVGKKPAPDGVLAALKELNSSKEHALYIGDSEVDIQTAHNAGLKCVGVTWGFRTRELLLAEGADIIVDTPRELLDFLLTQNT
ncbi:phosphoglycolate phosphatase [Anaerocolumna cellulosilytica]|uniref:Phosphoglycolate phosphatase n=1 Tax=Anaerocolumna cellulosilytica TaxID=433286 RepID=A0A6S6R6T4_9FIRM|nr:HAD family hydrolase [Anaerocolumna cellulosilytica]MBB5197616.1 phosphoglycolate phosphatase [Anaerocolumna cellulosilytica]BCJ95142.1 phosphoglycolate phosphatase [Anaerocolumna cellulosilytica]